MNLIHDLCWCAGGLLLTNATPHFVSGVTGRSFQSPFASPPGEGLSSPVVNIAWGWVNLAAGWALLARVGAFDVRAGEDAASIGLGVLLAGLGLGRYFGRLHGGDLPRTS